MISSKMRNFTIEQKTINIRKYIFLSLLVVNFFLLIACSIISLMYLDRMGIINSSQIVITEIFTLFIALFVLGILINQLVIIPKANSIEEPFFRFRLYLICILISTIVPWNFGLIISFLGIQQNGGIYWILSLVLYIITFVYLVYFYIFYYSPSLKKIKVGKTLKIKSRKLVI